MTEHKDLYPNANMNVEKAKELSEAHAEWFCKMIKPLLISFGVHFYGHGYNYAMKLKKDEGEA